MSDILLHKRYVGQMEPCRPNEVDCSGITSSLRRLRDFSSMLAKNHTLGVPR